MGRFNHSRNPRDRPSTRSSMNHGGPRRYATIWAMPLIVVISGPIGSGKTTVAQALGTSLRKAGRTVAVVGLDAVFKMIGGFEGLPGYASRTHAELPSSFSPAWFKAAREVHGRLVGSWFDRDADVVVDGPFLNAEAEAPFLRELPPDVELRRLRLLVSYDVALGRVMNDAMPRNLSRDPLFLRNAHEHFTELVPSMPAADWTFHSETVAPDDVAASVAESLLVEATKGA